MFGYFYHSQIRTYCTLMGNLFNNISIMRENKGQIKVPITYGQKEAFIQKLTSKLNTAVGDHSPLGVEQILPRMNLSLIDITYDGQAKTATTLQQHQMQSKGRSRQQFNMIPYIFTFELGVYTRYQDDMYQIVEQIFPYFTPYFISEIKERYEDGVEVDHKVPIYIMGVTPDEAQANGTNERRRLEWSIQFQLRGYFYPPSVQNGAVIKTMFLNFGIGNDQQYEQLDYQVFPDDAVDGQQGYISATQENKPIPEDKSVRGKPKAHRSK